MMKKRLTLVLFSLTLLLVSPAWAEGSCEEELFTPCNKDISIVFLDSITGDMRSDNPQTVFAAMFAVFNSMAVSIGLFFIVFTVLTATIKIASSGKFLGEEGNLTKAARIVLGLILILPHASGFSNIQIVFKEVIVSGVGLADSVWSSALRHLDFNSFFLNTGSVESTENTEKKQRLDENEETMRALWRGMLCSYYYNTSNGNSYGVNENGDNIRAEVFAYDNPLIARTQAPTINDYEDGSLETEHEFYSWFGPSFRQISADEAVFSFGNNDEALKNEPFDSAEVSQCGYVEVLPEMRSGYISFLSAIHNAISPTLLNLKDQHDLSNCGRIENYGDEIAESQTPLKQAIDEVATFVPPASSFTEKEEGLESEYAEYGWAVAGFYYNKLLVTNEARTPPFTLRAAKATELDPNIAAANFYGNSTECDTVFTAAKSSYESENNLTAFGSTASSQNAIEKIFAEHGNDSGSVNAGWVSFLGTFVPVARLADIIYGSTGFSPTGNDPFKHARDTGKKIMGTASGMLITAISLMIIQTIVVSICGAQQPAALFTEQLFNLLIVMLFFLIASAYLQGVMLAIVLPMVPVIIFCGGVLGWLFSVFEAFVAAPFAALGLLWPGESDDIWGKSEPSLMILLNIFLRPALMVIGFLMGLFLCWVAFTLLALTFKVALDRKFIQTDLLVGFIPVGFMYAALLIVIATKSFSLVFELPDKILTWIGAQTMSWGDADELLMATQSGAKEGAQSFDKMSSGMEQQQKTAHANAKDQEGSGDKDSGAEGGGAS